MEHLSAPDVLLLTAQMHKASPRAGQPVPGMPRRRMSGVAEAEFEAEAEAEEAAISRANGAPGGAATKLHVAKMSAVVQGVPPPLLIQLPPLPLRTRVSHEGYNFSSTVSLPPLSRALPKAVIRVRKASREQLDVQASKHNEAALGTSPRGTAQSRNRFSNSHQPAASNAPLGPPVAAPPPSKAHQHGQRRSQHQSMQGIVSNQTEAPLDALARVEARIVIATWSRTEQTAQKAVAELWQVEARWRSLGLPKHLATTELMAELRDNPPLPGTSPLGTKGVMAAEVARQQGDICGKLHGFLPKATQEAAAKDHLARRSSQWSDLRSGGVRSRLEASHDDVLQGEG